MKSNLSLFRLLSIIFSGYSGFLRYLVYTCARTGAFDGYPTGLFICSSIYVQLCMKSFMSTFCGNDFFYFYLFQFRIVKTVGFDEKVAVFTVSRAVGWR